MICSIEIKGLRGIQEGRLDDLTPLVVLVGPNNSGKSTVLDALLIGAKPDVTDAIVTAVSRRSGLVQKARWLISRQERPNQCSIFVQTHSGKGRKVFLSLPMPQPENQVRISGNVRWFEDVNDVSTGSSIGLSSITFSDDGAGGYSPAIVPMNDVADVHMVDAEMVNGLAPLYDLYSKAVEQGRRKEVRMLITDLISSVDDILVLTEGNRPILHLDYGNGTVPVALAGEGIQSLLRLSLELAARPDGVVLLEEPEVHQHPAAIQQSARAIWAAIRRGIQVIISTHSLELIDSLLVEVNSQEELDMLSVYRLLLRDGCLRSSRTAGSDIAFARTEIGDDLR